MSQDRVRFRLSGDTVNARAAQRAFGLTCSHAYHAVCTKQTIICRPDQFARFIIYRGSGTTEQFHAKLIPAPEHCDTLDVTRNP